tara:strand:- start:319 stop:621 length:303 start_codon:yes stop_codon:yes gene_type:complete
MGKTNKDIERVIKEVNSLKVVDGVRYVFSYISIGNTLDELKAEVIHNLKDDLASNALTNIIDEKVFDNPIVPPKESFKDKEAESKLHMFNLFNKGKKFNA